MNFPSLLLLTFLFLYQGVVQVAGQSEAAKCSDVDLQNLHRRTLLDIVRGCLVTIYVCSWASVHPDVPTPEQHGLKRLSLRIRLMFQSMINPESILLWAMNQWYVAGKLAEKYRAQDWTKTHGYFIQMGGFVLYEGSVRREVLTPDRLAALVAEGAVKVPEVKEEDLQDRSKRDGMSKAVVLIQTLWFTTQSIAQFVSPCVVITHLEIVTFALALLNGMMYFFWWNKPLGVHWTVPVYMESNNTLPEANNRNPGPVESVTTLSVSQSHPQLYTLSRGHDEIEAKKFDSYELTTRSNIQKKLDNQVKTRDKMGCPAFGSFVFEVPASLPKRKRDKYFKICFYTLTYFISALLGLIHLVGIVAGVGFVTATEQEIWITCAAVVTGLSFITGILLLILFFKRKSTQTSKGWAFTRKLVFYVLMFSRFGFFVVAIMDLRGLPKAAFYVWNSVSYIPHI